MSKMLLNSLFNNHTMSRYHSPNTVLQKSKSQPKVLFMNNFAREMAHKISKQNLFSPDYSYVDDHSSYSRTGKKQMMNPMSTKHSAKYNSYQSNKNRGHSRSISYSKDKGRKRSVNEYEVSDKTEPEFKRERSKMRFKHDNSYRETDNGQSIRERELLRTIEEMRIDLERYKKNNKKLKEELYARNIEADRTNREMKKRIAYLEQKLEDNNSDQMKLKIERYKEILKSEKDRSNQLIRENRKMREKLNDVGKERSKGFNSSLKSNKARDKSRHSRKGSFINREESEYSDYGRNEEKTRMENRSTRNNTYSKEVLPRNKSKSSRLNYDYSYQSKYHKDTNERPNEYGRSRSKKSRRKSSIKTEHLVENFESFGLAPPSRNKASFQSNLKRI